MINLFSGIIAFSISYLTNLSHVSHFVQLQEPSLHNLYVKFVSTSDFIHDVHE